MSRALRGYLIKKTETAVARTGVPATAVSADMNLYINLSLNSP